MKKIKLFVNQHFHISIILLFIFLSIIFYIPVTISGKWIFGDDGLFHLSRVYELVDGLKNGKIFPDISAFTFNEKMYGVMFFYPYITVYPIAIIIYLLGKFYGFILGLIIINFFVLFLSYWSMYKFSSSRKKAIIFCFAYSFSNYVLVNQFVRCNIAEWLAMAFLPVAAYGIYQVFIGDHKQYIYMVLGIQGFIYSHILSSFMLFLCIVFLFSYILVKNNGRIEKERLLSLIKAIILIMLLSAIIIVPLFEQLFFAKISGPHSYNLSTDSISFFLNGIFSNSLEIFTKSSEKGAIGFLYVVYLILVTYLTIKQKAFTKNMKVASSLTIVFIILSTSLFPWFLLQKSFFGRIQFTWRFMMFVSLFSSIYLSEGLAILPKKHLMRIITILLINTYVIVFNFFSLRLYDDIPLTLSVPTFNFQLNDNLTNLGMFDYLTKEQQNVTSKDYPGQLEISSILTDKVVLINGRKSNLKMQHCNYVFYVDGLHPRDKNILMPMTWLKGMKASDEQGRELTLLRSNKGYPIIKNNGSRTVRIMYHKTIAHKISILVSILSGIILVVYLLVKKICNDLKSKFFYN